MKYVFYAAVAMATALGVVLINNLPTIFDIVVLAIGTVGGAVAGRKSSEYF